MPPSASNTHHKRNLAVKRQDGEPLTRADLQYDLLEAIFADKHAVFTDPHTTIRGDPAGTKVTFRDLYVNALIHSPRCSKMSRDKIRELPLYGNEFAMISLLSNVGRINTTMAFFPEMKTALRTFHPVPALQRTNGNLQDAPRIKNILKTCFMADETQGTVTTPGDVLARSRSGKVPPTSIVNLLFVFASHSSTVSRSHFAPRSPTEFLDLFTPVAASSASRARAFLWLCFHYHEAPAANPFADASCEGIPDRAPALVPLTPDQARAENVDTPEEAQRAADMAATRRRFLEAKAREEMGRGEEEEAQGVFARQQYHHHHQGQGQGQGQNGGPRGRGKGKGRGYAETAAVFRTRDTSPDESQYSLSYYREREDDVLEGPGRPALRHRSPAPFDSHSHSHSHAHPHSHPHSHLHSYAPPSPPPSHIAPAHRRHQRAYSPDARAGAEPYPHPHPRRAPSPDALVRHSNGKPVRHHHGRVVVHEHELAYAARTKGVSVGVGAAEYAPSSPDTPQRTMLEQAWHVSTTTDPLVDSDDESCVDEHTRLDYVLRLRIISRLRGKEPTPERDLGPPPFGVHAAPSRVAVGAR